MEILEAFKGMNHLHLVDKVIDEHNLHYYACYFESYNISHYLPYHNRYHSRCMVMNCHEAAVYHNLNKSDSRSLIAAALFHDFNHSGGQFADDVNIKKAVSGFEKANQWVTAHGATITSLSEEEFLKAIDTIRITEYPYTKDPESQIQKIIRDADLMQVYEEDQDQLVKQFLGLKDEVELLKRLVFTKDQWISGNREFYNNVVWNTEWAKQKAQVLNYGHRVDNLIHLLGNAL